MRALRPIGALGWMLAVPLLMGAVLPPDPLLDAVRAGDAPTVESLLAGGADPNVAQGDGLTALHVAAEQGDAEITRLLVGAKANVEAKTRIGDYTPLHLASAGGHSSIVRSLLEAGADLHAVTTSTGVTPLHLAAKALNGESTVRVLLEHGAPVNAREAAAGQTPLMFAAAAGRTASVRELLSHGADPAIRTTVIDVLERSAIENAAREHLQEAVAEIRRSAPEGSDRVLTSTEAQAAIAAQRSFVRSGEIERVLGGFHPDDLAGRSSWYKGGPEFVSRPSIETLVGKTGGMTALLHAAREGLIETAEALLDGGADIDQASGDGSTPLVFALLNGQFDLAVWLIGRGADPTLVTHTDEISPLFAVLQTQWALQFTYQPQPRAHDNQGAQHIDVLRALLESGADPNVRLKTHLWHWEWEGKMGIDVTGATPLWRAAFAQDVEAMKLLVAHGADPHIPTIWPEVGLRPRRTPDGRQQEDSGLPHFAEGAPNMWPIHAAAGGGYMGLGAFQQNNVPNNFLDAVKFLVELGADVNLPDAWGYTPLHYASVRGGNDLIEFLVAQGADVKATSRLGQSVVDMARGGMGGFFHRNAYPETVELLRSLGSPFKCFSTHFRDTGDYCPGSGVPPFDETSVYEVATPEL